MTYLGAASVAAGYCWLLYCTVAADFPIDSGRPTADGIHDVPIAPAAVVISNVNFGALLQFDSLNAVAWLYFFFKRPCFCWRLDCAGGPVVAFVPDVAGGHAIAVIAVA